MEKVGGAGKIILLNGASSSGKTTLARALRDRMTEPFWHYSADHFWDGDIPPMARIRNHEFDWASMREAFFEGLHRSLPALAQPGNNLIVEHIVETPAWMSLLVDLLAPFDVFFVGVHCPLDELERRELARGNRRAGDARRDFETIHGHCRYDVEVDSTNALEDNVDRIVDAWRTRTAPSAFDLLAQSLLP